MNDDGRRGRGKDLGSHGNFEEGLGATATYKIMKNERAL